MIGSIQASFSPFEVIQERKRAFEQNNLKGRPRQERLFYIFFGATGKDSVFLGL